VDNVVDGEVVDDVVILVVYVVLGDDVPEVV
jgi:hypothetical protein